MSGSEKEKQGLELLEDDVLAGLVVEDIRENGELTAPHAFVAFEELRRRTPRK